MKCKNTDCCSKTHSSYFSIVPTRFLPPPFPTVQSDGLKAPDLKDVKEVHKFPSLFVALSLQVNDVLPKSLSTEYPVLPYDLYCPSVKNVLKDRCCKVCKMYFASIVMMKKHCSQYHRANSTPVPEIVVPRIHPVRVAARRQRELMVIIARGENRDEDAEWLNEDEVDVSDMNVPEAQDNGGLVGESMPIISLKDHFDNPWQEE